MKKSQRLRLAALQAKDAATLTAIEKTELGSLVALAVNHADASKDEDDTQPAAPAPLTASGFMAKLTAAFREKESLATELAQAKQTIADQAGQLTAANAAKATAETALAAANTAKTAAETSLAAAQGQVTLIVTALGIKPAEALTNESLQSAFNARVDAGATERLASLGFPMSGLPVVDVAGSGSGAEADLLAQYNAMPASNPDQAAEKAAFLQKHQKQIIK